MNFYSFDAEYLRRLKEGDSSTEEHFAKYFGELLLLKLRSRLRSRQVIDDVRQETLMRVIKSIRGGQTIDHPERFGAFVNAVCNNVLREFYRRESRFDSAAEMEIDPVDDRVDLDRPLVNSDCTRQVNKALSTLPERDRLLLRMVFLEELDKAEICRQFEVDTDYFRVLLHRAKTRFRRAYSEVR